MRTLLALDIYEMTTTQIAKHFKPGTVDLPEFCISEKGYPRRTLYYHQFDFEGEEKHILFNARACDAILEEEIHNCGVEELIDFDLRLYMEAFREQGAIKQYEDYQRSLATSSYLVVDLNFYKTGGYEYPNEWDMDVNIDGVLDKNLNFVELKTETCQKEKQQ